MWASVKRALSFGAFGSHVPIVRVASASSFAFAMVSTSAGRAEPLAAGAAAVADAGGAALVAGAGALASTAAEATAAMPKSAAIPTAFIR